MAELNTRAEWAAAAALTCRLQRRPARATSAGIVCDPAVIDTDITDLVLRWLRSQRIEPVARPLIQDAGLAARIDHGRHLNSFDLVVAIGGGSVLDQVKVATLVGAEPVAARFLQSSQRAGFVILPSHLTRTCPLLAVPTTVGTGSEASAVAVLDEGQRRRLVVSPGLRPDAAILDVRATHGLPAALVRRGALEILARLTGPYTGDLEPLGSLADDLVEAAARRCVVVGTSACLTDPASAPDRLELARLSTFSHSAALGRPASPWSSKLWPIANELASVAGVAKMTATAALWPQVWHAVLASDRRFGCATRVRRIWKVIQDAAPMPLADDPVRGLQELIDIWGVDAQVRLTGDARDAVADRTARAWAGGLPVLGGVSARDIADLVDRSCLIDPRTTAPPESHLASAQVSHAPLGGR